MGAEGQARMGAEGQARMGAEGQAKMGAEGQAGMDAGGTGNEGNGEGSPWTRTPFPLGSRTAP